MSSIGWGRVLLAAFLGVALAAACQATQPEGGGPVTSAAPAPSGLMAGAATVTMSGSTVQIVGLGTATTPEFDLPAGTAEIKVTACSSNQVPPFVQLYDANNNNLGFIVDPVYRARNLVGGKYYLAVQANPDCVWMISLAPG